MCNLNEVGAKGGPVSEDDIKGLSPQLSKQIEGMAKDSVDAAFFGLSSDIFEFSKIIRKKFPDYFTARPSDKFPKPTGVLKSRPAPTSTVLARPTAPFKNKNRRSENLTFRCGDNIYSAFI